MNFYSLKKLRIGKSIKIFILAFLAAGGYLSSASSEYVKIVDGDSLEVGGKRVRLLEIDAPEYKQYCFTQQGDKYDCGKESFKYLKQMIKEANFKVICYSNQTDHYHRDLSECFAGDKNLNLEMIKAGWAVVYRTENQTYILAEKEAKKLKKGLWQGKFMRPEYYRRLNRR